MSIFFLSKEVEDMCKFGIVLVLLVLVLGGGWMFVNILMVYLFVLLL